MAFIEINAGLYANPEHVEWVADADKHPSITQGQAPAGSSVVSIGGFIFVAEEAAQSLAERVLDGQKEPTGSLHPEDWQEFEGRPTPGRPTPDGPTESYDPDNPIPDENAFAGEVAEMDLESRMTVMSLIERLHHTGGSPDGKDRVAIKKLLQQEQPPNVRHFLNSMLAK